VSVFHKGYVVAMNACSSRKGRDQNMFKKMQSKKYFKMNRASGFVRIQKSYIVDVFFFETE